MYIWGATYVKVGNFNFIFIHYHSNVILLVKKLYKNYIWGAIYVKVSNFNFLFIHYHTVNCDSQRRNSFGEKSVFLKRNIHQMFPIKPRVLLSNHSKSEICCLQILQNCLLSLFTPAIVLPGCRIFFCLYETFDNFDAFSAILRPD